MLLIRFALIISIFHPLAYVDSFYLGSTLLAHLGSFQFLFSIFISRKIKKPFLQTVFKKTTHLWKLFSLKKYENNTKQCVALNFS